MRSEVHSGKTEKTNPRSEVQSGKTEKTVAKSEVVSEKTAKTKESEAVKSKTGTEEVTDKKNIRFDSNVKLDSPPGKVSFSVFRFNFQSKRFSGIYGFTLLYLYVISLFEYIKACFKGTIFDIC